MVHLGSHLHFGESSSSYTKYSKCDTDEPEKTARTAYVRGIKATSRTIHQQAVNKVCEHLFGRLWPDFLLMPLLLFGSSNN
jgi:hypothetical protein